jgi:serine/threonine protein kinase
MAGIEKVYRESPRLWKTLSPLHLPKATAKGEILDLSGTMLCRLTPVRSLSYGTFGLIELFKRHTEKESIDVVLKRPKARGVNLLVEAFFQNYIYEHFSEFNLAHAVPKVYDIFFHKSFGEVMFTMEYIDGSLLSVWCLENICKPGGVRLFVLLLLQIALVLEVLENEFRSDHRDLKVNNILVKDIPIELDITWRGKEKKVYFPFQVIFIDFGFACRGDEVDVRALKGLEELDPCPKTGRDLFQILANFWSMPSLRGKLNTLWGKWIVERLSLTNTDYPCVRLCETKNDLNWLQTVTDDKGFCAPLCAPKKIIQDCMLALEDSL